MSIIKVTNISPKEGSLAGGELITITGTGFPSTTPAINFGVAGASNINVISSTEITCTNPNTAKAGTVPISLVYSTQTIPAGNFDYKLPEVTGSPKEPQGILYIHGVQ